MLATACVAIFQEHSKTQTDVVEKLKAEVADLKKELRQRKKIIATQQQLLQGGGDSYNKVMSWFDALW
jgi:adenylosuccinate lyase